MSSDIDVAEAERIAPSHWSRAPEGWWPIDKLILFYLAATALLILAFMGRLPEAWWLLALHAAGAALIFAAVKSPPSRSRSLFRHWYALPYVGFCYKEMSILIPPIRGRDFDAALARLDYWFWGANPTVWLERIYHPWLTEFLQVVYSLFVPAVLLVAALVWRKRRLEEFRYCAFLISLGFLVSYAGYILAPARGPRFLLHPLQHIDLKGLWLFQPLQQTLDRLEAAHYDCFPSGHTELTILACWSSRQISTTLFRVYLVYTLCIIFATVYLRYHYTVDLLAGILVAAALVAMGPHIYKALGRGR